MSDKKEEMMYVGLDYEGNPRYRTPEFVRDICASVMWDYDRMTERARLEYQLECDPHYEPIAPRVQPRYNKQLARLRSRSS